VAGSPAEMATNDVFTRLSSGGSLCFGEILVRLATPDHRLLSQSPSLDVVVGGAEANVAVGLATLGRNVRMASRLPANPLGDLALRALRSHGVDCRGIALSEIGRMGLYFVETGTGLRASRIVYDRKGSSFALSPAADYDWSELFDGISHLHLSGITPALCYGTAEAAIHAAQAARARNIVVSFDGNYRSLLWDERGIDPRPILADLFSLADIAFANHRDVSLLLGRTYAGDGPARRRQAAEAAFSVFPNLQLMASTARRVEEADRQFIAARIDTRDDEAQTDEVLISSIVDRIGTGDAFATGVLYALANDRDIAQAARSGLALAALKHGIAGDFCLVTPAQLDGFLAGDVDVQR